MSEFVIRETISTKGVIEMAKQTPIDNDHHDLLHEHGWTLLAIIQKAAGEPCHRSEYGLQGECKNIQDSGPDMHYACARCVARVFLRDLAEKAEKQEQAVSDGQGSIDYPMEAEALRRLREVFPDEECVVITETWIDPDNPEEIRQGVTIKTDFPGKVSATGATLEEAMAQICNPEVKP